MGLTQELDVHGVSSAAEKGIRERVFATLADLNISDFRVRAYGNSRDDSISVFVTRTANGHTEQLLVADSASAGYEIEAAIRRMYPPAAREVFDGGTFLNRHAT